MLEETLPSNFTPDSQTKLDVELVLGYYRPPNVDVRDHTPVADVRTNMKRK